MTHLKEKKKKRIALTWWSTWWHIFPLLSVYKYFKEENNYDYIWVWEEESLEEEIAWINNIPFLGIPAWKIRRYFDFRNFYQPLKNLTGIIFWFYYILKYKIDIVFSKWWYVSLPLCIAAFFLRKKIYIHESDIVWWIANKIIWKLATKIFYTFPNNKTDWKKHIVTWQILNPDLLEPIEDLYIWQNEQLSILVIGWSQWSNKIFKTLLKILPDLKDIKFTIILWNKNVDFRKKFNKFKNIKTYDFISQKEMWSILKTIDIAITRAWATSLWELNMFGIHSLIIPLNWSAWDHQNKNALYFNEKFWSDILNEDINLKEELSKLILKYKDLRKSGLNLKHFYRSLEIIEKEMLNIKVKKEINNNDTVIKDKSKDNT